jgi:hypothetical protein
MKFCKFIVNLYPISIDTGLNPTFPCLWLVIEHSADINLPDYLESL